MKEEIIEYNKLLAEFDGWTIEMGMETIYNPFYNKKPFNICLLSDMAFSTSWAWLMPVWFKFLDLHFDNVKHEFEHSDFKSEIGSKILYDNDKTPIKAFNALAIAIKWYNNTQN